MSRIVNYVVFDPLEGRIRQTGVCSEADLPLLANEGEQAIEGVADSLTDWVPPATGEISPRPTMPVSVNGHVLSAPPGTQFSVLGPATASGVTETGELEFEFDEPGVYAVRLQRFPYRDREVTLEG